MATSTIASDRPVVSQDAGTEQRTVTVTNRCQCAYCADCEMGVVTDSGDCPECGREVVYIADCFGCYEDAQTCLADAVAGWMHANPAPHGLYVVFGSNMGWRHLSGYKIVREGDNVSEAISVNSDWVQRWTVEAWSGGALTASQSHHDSWGESYTFAPVSEEDAAEAMDSYYH